MDNSTHGMRRLSQTNVLCASKFVFRMVAAFRSYTYRYVVSLQGLPGADPPTLSWYLCDGRASVAEASSKCGCTLASAAVENFLSWARMSFLTDAAMDMVAASDAAGSTMPSGAARRPVPGGKVEAKKRAKARKGGDAADKDKGDAAATDWAGAVEEQRPRAKTGTGRGKGRGKKGGEAQAHARARLTRGCCNACSRRSSPWGSVASGRGGSSTRSCGSAASAHPRTTGWSGTWKSGWGAVAAHVCEGATRSRQVDIRRRGGQQSLCEAESSDGGHP